MESTSRPSRCSARVWLYVLLLLCPAQMGCLNSIVMLGKVMLGDPKQTSGFEMATGISLVDEQKTVLIHCSAPAYLTGEFDTLASDIEVELGQRLRRHSIALASRDAADDAIDDLSGHFDPKLLAPRLQGVDYIFHVKFERFSYLENNSPNLYRGNAGGQIIAFECRGDGPTRHAVQVYDQQFQNVHPSTHPVSADQIPKNVFIQRFIDRIADDLGTTFYDAHNSELFVN